jgi:hypothetical protein
MASMNLADHLSGLSDAELLAAAETPGSVGWAAVGTARVEGTTVFVKRLPLTDVELAAASPTANHFGLPTYYSYGVGSAGFGAWRELAANELVRDLDGFPTLLHHRVLERTTEPGRLPWSDAEYVQYWNGEESVGAFRSARDAARHELWLVLEHVPEPIMTWLFAHPEDTGAILDELIVAARSLDSVGLVHFDAHLGNAVTDGKRVRLADLGLAMAASFDLSDEERAFRDRHRHYDVATILGSFGMIARAVLGPMSAAELDTRIRELVTDRGTLHEALVPCLMRFREPIVVMVDFFDRMRQPTKSVRYEDDVIGGMLAACGVP